MIEREITGYLIRLFQQYPFVTVTGPRQSGKTTLCRSAFPHLNYANLEAPDLRDFAESDPRGFLSQFGEGAILDEIQNVPGLLSYLQVLADEKGRNGLFVLTGSEQFRLSDAISQSLAGRTALLRLLPLSIAERRRMGADDEVDNILYSGFYPRIFDQDLDPRQALGDYFETYVERDVRRLGGIRNLSTFRRFVSLCAGRVGQLVNLSSLGSDAGVSHTTAREWLGVLERSYIIFQLRPYYANIGKRLVKTSKLYFYDVGLVSYLIGVEHPRQIATHPLRGGLFENVVVIEALKHGFNQGREPNLSFFRDARGLECDLFYETGRGIGAIEIKSGSTVTSDYFRSLHRVAELVPEVTFKAVVYGGASRQSRSDCEVVPVTEVGGVLRMLEVEQDIAAFVKEKGGSGPKNSDIETLDRVYQSHIWPMLTRLHAALKPLGDKLFRGIQQSFTIAWQNRDETINGLMSPEQWDVARREFLVEEGFDLSGRWRFELKHECKFKCYTGEGWKGFDALVRIVWRFDGQGFLRFAVINGERIDGLDFNLAYSEVATREQRLDYAVAEIGGSLIRAIGQTSLIMQNGSQN